MTLTETEQAILHLLESKGEMTPKEIAAAVGLNYRSMYRSKTAYLRKLRKLNLAYICAWRRQTNKGGPPIPVWAAGERYDAPRPEPLKVAERCAKNRRKKKLIQADKSMISILLGTRKAPVKPADKSIVSITLGV